MNLEQYLKRIASSALDGNKRREKLQELITQAGNDSELSDDDKLAIELQVRNVLSSLPNEDTESKNDDDSEPKRLRYFPVYEFANNDELFLDDGMQVFGGYGVPFAIWLKDVYLPTFHPMPEPSIVYPLMTCMMLLNCNATLGRNQKIPILYALGKQGSGKSLFTKAIMDMYPKELSIEFRPDNTGASIRDALDSLFGNDEPGIAVFDNFHPQKSLERLGAFYSIILANDKASSISRLSTTGSDSRKDVYITWCYKAMSSIFDLSASGISEAKEIERRCIVIPFKAASPQENRNNYSWLGMQKGYQTIWGTENLALIKSEYVNILKKIIKLKPAEVPIKDSRWEICQIPLAVGIFTKIFPSLNAGLEYFENYFKWLENGGKGKHAFSTTSMVIEDYIKKEIPALIEKDKKNSWLNPSAMRSINRIKQKDLKEYIENATSFKIGKRDLEEISAIMADLGYGLERLDDSIYYVKE